MSAHCEILVWNKVNLGIIWSGQFWWPLCHQAMPGLRWKPVMTLLLCGDPPGLCQITLGLRWDQTLVTDILTRSARMACAKLDSTVRILTTLEHLSCCCHPALHGDSLWPEVVMQSLLVAYNILQMYDGCFRNQMWLNINLEWNRSNAC